MSKITRVNQSIFAGNISAPSHISQFGSLKAGAPVYSTDLDTIQALAAWGEGWNSGVINSYNPTIQDFNALIYVITRQLAYLFQAGIPEWDSITPYYIGSYVQDGFGTIYRSVSDANVGAAFTDATKWLNYRSIAITDIGTANYTVLNTDYMIRWSTAATTVSIYQVILPSPTAAMKGREVIIKAVSQTTTPATGIEISVSGGSTINTRAHIHALQYQARRLICDGSNWFCVSDYGM
jgi:hypothetical protein